MRPIVTRAIGAALAGLTALAALGVLAGTGSTADATAPARPRPATTVIGAATGSGIAAGPSLGAGKYIVVFAAPPAAAYTGTRSGYAATRPVAGQHLRTDSRAVTSYRQLLTRVQSQTLARVGIPASRVTYHYTVALNGVATRLDARQAVALAKQPQVAMLLPDRMEHTQSTTAPGFLGLTGKSGLWNQLGGDSLNGAGKGVIVGVIDTGVWPQNPGLQAGPLPAPVKGWHGRCVAGEAFALSACNRKLIGARWFDKSFGPAHISASDYLSARDYEGHGTHTSTTAVGKPTTATIDGKSYGQVSGIAPGAYLAMYKACWTDTSDQNGCSGGDLVAAIDRAVADGVDVINYSIGGPEADPASPENIAFLGAAEAGVFVSASAGNSGPGASTLDHVVPWVTTVAASTYTTHEKVAITGDGHRYVGASLTGNLSATPAVLAKDATLAPATPADAALCAPGSLDPAVVTGKVVVCERGIYARVDKSQEVLDEGGVGMILVNTSPDSLNADLHRIPTVHLDDVAGAAVEQYVANTANPTIAIGPLKPGESTTKVPSVAEFSSRGPSTTTGGDVLKPDIAAPGVDVLAGIAPVNDHGRRWDLLSGTSMAAPHIAGIGALLKAAHPTWSPMAIKSAMMTTTRQTVGTTSPFAQGAGNVQPTPAVSPGLVYDSGPRDWLGLMRGLGYNTSHLRYGAAPKIDPSDMNAASIAIGALPGRQTVTRTVTNVGSTAQTYRSHMSGLSGIGVTVKPATITVPAHGSKTFTVTFVRHTAKLETWASGALTWTGGGRHVRSPIAVRPQAVAAPFQANSTVATGSRTVTVAPGYSGTLATVVRGLVPGSGQGMSVGIGPNAFDPLNPVAGPAVVAVPITGPAATTALRLTAQAADSRDDIDLYLYDASNNLIGYSASQSGSETIEGGALPAGTYTAYINGYASYLGQPSSTFTFTKWLVDGTDTGTLSVTPSSTPVTMTVPKQLTLSWAGQVDVTKQYFGWVGYEVGGVVRARTFVFLK
jgi:subtilisin family serine protease